MEKSSHLKGQRGDAGEMETTGRRRPSSKELYAYYTEKALRLAELEATYEHPNWYKRFFYRARSDAVLQALDPHLGDRILDVGSGPGHYARRIHERGATVISTDVSAPYLREIPRGVGPRAIADATRLPFRADVFDKILATEVLEHVLEPERLLLEVGRVLKVGGKAVITSPSSTSYMDRAHQVKARLLRYPFSEHLQEFTVRSFVDLLSRHLTVQTVAFANCLVPYPLDLVVMRLPERVGHPVASRLEASLARGRGGPRFAWTIIAKVERHGSGGPGERDSS